MAGLINGVGVRTTGEADLAAAELRTTDGYQRTKFAIFNLVLEQLEALGITAETAPASMIRDGVEQGITRFAAKEGLALNAAERSLLAAEVHNEVVGLGPLEPLLKDPSIDDVIVNGPFRIFVERAGQLSAVPARFRDTAHLMNIIQRIVSPIGRRVDEATPYVDARLPDGSRVNVVIPPIALDGPMVSIRKFRNQAMAGQDYVRFGSMSQEMLGFLSAAVRSRLNILICGGTGSGKTTLLNMLSSYIEEKERLITIEDAAELQLRQSHVVRLETRPPNLDGSREVTARDLVRNALRMRPDRIILGEVRGAEAVEMLQAMSTGHDGSMATMHANSSRDAFGRLEMLLGFGGLSGDPKTLRRYIANSIQILVQVARMANGKRRITSVSELTGMEGESYSLNQLFGFDEQPPLSGLGEFKTLSARPYFGHRLVGVPDLRAAVARGLS
jgi:pilus assembly protein CpaF